MKGISYATVQPFIPWASPAPVDLAWETEPAPTPRKRAFEAFLQGHLRARERLTGDRGLAILPR